MSVAIRNLHIEYPDQLVFDQVNLSVSDQELVAIKTDVLDGATSFLSAIAGFLNGVEGEVIFRAHNLLIDPPPEITHQIGYVYETHGLISLYSVYENITLPLLFHADLSNPEINERAHAICELLGVNERIFRWRPHQLNDVQTRIVNLARALIVEPKLLLIDELEGGMSEEYLQATMEILRARQRESRMAIIMTTSHEMIMEMADRVYRIEDHNLVPENPT